MKKFVRIASALLALLTTASFAACGAAASSPTGGTAVTTSGETEAETTTEDPYKPDLPDMDFDGAAYRMISRDDSMHSYPMHTRDLIAEEQTGDVINDAVYARNLRISEKYNVTFTLVTENENTSETTTVTMVEKSVVAGSDEYDLLCVHMIYGAASVIKGYYLNWNALPYVDTAKPYWSQGAVEGYSVAGKLLLSLSDMCVSSNDCTHCMLYNKEMATNYSTGNLYDLVYNNKWTFDQFRTLTKNVTADLNGDGVFDKNDQYGYCIGGDSGQLNFLWAGGSHVTARGDDGIPYLDMNTERTINIYDWLYELKFSGDAFEPDTNWSKPDDPEFFAANKALFMSTQIGVINTLRNMTADFGILPYPKWDEAQEKYGHYVDGHATLMCVPMTVGNQDKVGIITEALSYDSYKNLVPIYYNTVTQTKYTRDEDSAKMLDIIYNSRVFDFAYVYDNWTLAFAFSNMLSAKNASFTTFYAKNEAKELKALQKSIEAIESVGA